MATSTGNVDESQRVLSIQSHVVSGYVGNKCAVFPLQVLGFEVDFINSVQFSNHTGYGQWKGQILADTDLEDLYEGLLMNDLVNYNQILTGYVGSESFLRKIIDVVKRIKTKNPNAVYLCDPVLGDNGHFYVPESLIPIYQNEVLPLADITTPNNFELELLTGMKVTNEDEALTAIKILHDKGIPIVVLSSLDATGQDLASYVSLQPKNGQRKVWKTIIPRLQGIFTGTGDVFAALFLGWYSKLGSNNIPKVIETVLSSMTVILSRTKAKADKRKSAQPSSNGKTRPQELQLIQSLDVIINPPNACTATEISVKS